MHRVDLAVTLGISKPNVSIVARTTLVLLLLFAKNARSQETEPAIVTDRPDVTESSIVVPKGSLQLENGITWTADHGNQSVDFSETLVRLGVSTRTELRLVTPNYLKDVTSSNASGFNDIAVGVKQQLGPLWGAFRFGSDRGSEPAHRSGPNFEPWLRSVYQVSLVKGPREGLVTWRHAIYLLEY